MEYRIAKGTKRKLSSYIPKPLDPDNPSIMRVVMFDESVAFGHDRMNRLFGINFHTKKDIHNSPNWFSVGWCWMKDIPDMVHLYADLMWDSVYQRHFLGSVKMKNKIMLTIEKEHADDMEENQNEYSIIIDHSFPQEPIGDESTILNTREWRYTRDFTSHSFDSRRILIPWLLEPLLHAPAERNVLLHIS